MMKDQMRVGIATDHGGFELKEESGAATPRRWLRGDGLRRVLPTIPMMTIRIS